MDLPYRTPKSLPLAALVVLLLSAGLSAQNFDSPGATATQTTASKRQEQVFSKKIFWTEVAAFTVSNILDGYTTVAHSQGYEEAGFPRGSSYLLGKQPSAARYAITMGALQVGTSFAAYRLEHSQKRYLRIVGHALMLQGIYSHTDGYIGNVVLLSGNPNSPQAKLASASAAK